MQILPPIGCSHPAVGASITRQAESLVGGILLSGRIQAEEETMRARRSLGHERHTVAGHDVMAHRMNGAIAEDARVGRATKVYVTGTLRTFAAPTNAVMQTGIYLEVKTSSGVELAP